MSDFKHLELGIGYPYGIISDVHCHNWSAYSHYSSSGINSRLEQTLDAIETAAKKVLEQGGRDLIITGDLFHTRGSIKPTVLNPTIELFERLIASGLRVHGFDGNHDAEGIHVTPMGSSMYTLSKLKDFNVFYEPTIVDEKFLFIPWTEKHHEVLDLTTKGSNLFSNLTIFCHVGMSGVLPGNFGDTLHPADFDKLDIKYVFSGHFHNHVSFNSRIYSVGALVHQTWGDVGSRAGYVIVSEDKVEQFETDAPKFLDFEDDTTFSPYGNYVRIKDIELTEEESRDLVREIKQNGMADAVLDQSTRPTIKSKDHLKVVKVDLGLDTALETYCKHTYGDNWEKVFKACLRLKS
jgi:DNA repair exonuclease SbcCD nuclease subunit